MFAVFQGIRRSNSFQWNKVVPGVFMNSNKYCGFQYSSELKCTFSSQSNSFVASVKEQPTTELDMAFRKTMNEYRTTKAPRKIMNLALEYHEKENFSPYMAFLTVRSLNSLNRQDLGDQIAGIWMKVLLSPKEWNEDSLVTFVVKNSISRNMVAAESLFQAITESNRTVSKETLGVIMKELIHGFGLISDIDKVYHYLTLLKSCDKLYFSNEIAYVVLRNILKAQKPLETVIKVIEAMLSLKELDPDGTENLLGEFEFSQVIASHYMRRIGFLKGCLRMDQLPDIWCSDSTEENLKIRPEIAFIGRSNVGKSSLINMITNRKSLAHTSKSPGKTSEFNYFLSFGGDKMYKDESKDRPAEKVVGIKKYKSAKKFKHEAREAAAEAGEYKHTADVIASGIASGYHHQYYIVDMPGVGFAKATSQMRSSWLQLLQQYTKERSTLRVLFHLIDSRHGALDADRECFELLPTLPMNVRYVIVLTKVDKNRGNKVNAEVIRQVREEMNKRLITTINGVETPIHRDVPILATSAASKEGGAEMWLEILKGITKNKPMNNEIVKE